MCWELAACRAACRAPRRSSQAPGDPGELNADTAYQLPQPDGLGHCLKEVTFDHNCEGEIWMARERREAVSGWGDSSGRGRVAGRGSCILIGVGKGTGLRVDQVCTLVNATGVERVGLRRD